MTGWALGDPQGGFLVAPPLELLWLGAVNLGAALPVHEALATAAITGGAILAGRASAWACPRRWRSSRCSSASARARGRRADRPRRGLERAARDARRGGARGRAPARRSAGTSTASPRRSPIAALLAPVGAAVAAAIIPAFLRAVPAAETPLQARLLRVRRARVRLRRQGAPRSRGARFFYGALAVASPAGVLVGRAVASARVPPRPSRASSWRCSCRRPGTAAACRTSASPTRSSLRCARLPRARAAPRGARAPPPVLQLPSVHGGGDPRRRDPPRGAGGRGEEPAGAPLRYKSTLQGPLAAPGTASSGPRSARSAARSARWARSSRRGRVLAALVVYNVGPPRDPRRALPRRLPRRRRGVPAIARLGLPLAADRLRAAGAALCGVAAAIVVLPQRRRGRRGGHLRALARGGRARRLARGARLPTAYVAALAGIGAAAVAGHFHWSS